MDSCVSLEQIKLFHSIDRKVYGRLMSETGFEPKLSKYVVAFWYSLERRISYNFMVKMLSLPGIDNENEYSWFNALGYEAIVCLNYLYSDSPPPASTDVDHRRFPALCNLLNLKEFSLTFMFEDKEYTKRTMDRFIKDVCNVAFTDIPLQVPPNHHHSHDQPNPNHDDTTLFVTFSMGHPVSEEELQLLFTRNFGQCVEAIYMIESRTSEHPLSARVVVKSTSDMMRILADKDDALLKFSINGKDVRVRRCLPQKQPLDHRHGSSTRSSYQPKNFCV